MTRLVFSSTNQGEIGSDGEGDMSSTFSTVYKGWS